MDAFLTLNRLSELVQRLFDLYLVFYVPIDLIQGQAQGTRQSDLLQGSLEGSARLEAAGEQFQAPLLEFSLS